MSKKKLKIISKDGKSSTVENVKEFAFGKDYLFVYRGSGPISLDMQYINQVFLNDKSVKIPKRCLSD